LASFAALAALTVVVGACAAGDEGGERLAGEPDGASGLASAAGGVDVGVASAANLLDDPALEARLLSTVYDLAAFGEKRAGTPAGRAAGDYVAQRFAGAGLDDVAFESFSFNSFELHSSSLSFATSVDGVSQPFPLAGYKVFAYSGVGSIQNVEVVDVDEGRLEDYVVPVTGKVVLVKSVQSFHRTSQFAIARQKGAVGMIASSNAAANLSQSGGVQAPELGLGSLLAVSIGAVDAGALRAALAAGQTVRTSLHVDASLEPRKGRNVVGWRRRPGSCPGDPYLLVGAHYDSWHAGSIDNGTGVATMLEIAEATAGGAARDYDIAFVGYDAEEVGLLGGYDFMRRHLARNREPLSAFVHVDMTAIAKPEYMGGLVPRFFATTGNSPLGEIAGELDMGSLYQSVIGLDVVPAITGGLIPTDVQGLYWGGVDGSIAFSFTPFYHTERDTPDTVDTQFLARNTLAMKAFLDQVDAEPPASFTPKDPALFYAELNVDYLWLGPGVRVRVKVKDANGQPVKRPWVQMRLYVDDFTIPQGGQSPSPGGPLQETIGNDAGEASFVVSPWHFWAGHGARWLHARVGKEAERYPRGEQVRALP
jgi:hypothetical protein